MPESIGAGGPFKNNKLDKHLLKWTPILPNMLTNPHDMKSIYDA